MKRFGLLAFLTLVMFGLLIGAGEYRRLSGVEIVTVTLDSAASDSTIHHDTMFVGTCAGWRTLQSKIVLGDERSSHAGIGNDDSGKIWLYTIFGGHRYTVDSVFDEGLPCSLITMLHSNVGDSLLKDFIAFDIEVYDSMAADTVMTIDYPVTWEMILK